MSEQQPNNPLHGITLEQIITALVEHYGWKGLSRLINIQCFYIEPSIRSSLKFLRKNLSAREKVEALYVATQKDLRS
ncbi:MAG: VF530 family protein [Kiritimatiellae bacterium]|jgi:uncharacterized protein (DUF2132 family)|nr:VF530 family protein [Kiritimatiellia bacterium]